MSHQPPAPAATGQGLANALKAWRTAADLTQEDLAGAIGYSRSRVAAAESGADVPSRDFWERTDTALGASGHLLRAYDDDKSRQRTIARLRAIGAPPSPILTTDQATAALHMAATTIKGDIECDTELDLLYRQIHAIAEAYFTTPAEDLARGLAAARDLAASLFGIVRAMTPLRRLHLLTARMTGILAHLLLDTGDLARARDVAEAAWGHAEAAADGATMGWARSVQSLACYWSGFPATAAAYAREGAKHAPGGVVAVRLAALQARAYGRLGETQKVLDAIAHAAELRQVLPPDAAEPGGLMCFSTAKEWSYATTALLALPDMTHLPQALDRAEQVVELMAGLPGPDPLAAGLDLACARYLSGDLAGAVAALQPVATAPDTARTYTIRLRASSMATYIRHRHDALEAQALIALLGAIAAPALAR